MTFALGNFGLQTTEPRGHLVCVGDKNLGTSTDTTFCSWPRFPGLEIPGSLTWWAASLSVCKCGMGCVVSPSGRQAAGTTPTPCHRCDLGESQNLLAPLFSCPQNRNEKEDLPRPPHWVMVRGNLRDTAQPGGAEGPGWAPSPTSLLVPLTCCLWSIRGRRQVLSPLKRGLCLPSRAAAGTPGARQKCRRLGLTPDHLGGSVG